MHGHSSHAHSITARSVPLERAKGFRDLQRVVLVPVDTEQGECAQRLTCGGNHAVPGLVHLLVAPRLLELLLDTLARLVGAEEAVDAQATVLVVILVVALAIIVLVALAVVAIGRYYDEADACGLGVVNLLTLTMLAQARWVALMRSPPWPARYAASKTASAAGRLGE